MVKTADELALEERQKLEAEQQSENSTEEKQMSDLAAHIRTLWGKAKRAKSTIADLMIQDLRERNMEYSPEKLAQIRSIRSAEPFDPLVNRKCRTMEAWIREIYNQPGQISFAVEPTPVPELPEEMEKEITQRFYQEAITQLLLSGMQSGMAVSAEGMMETVQDMLPDFQARLKRLIFQKAKQAAEEMTKEVDDKFREGGWYKAIDECVYDIVTLRATILKGPIVRQEKSRRLSTNPSTGTFGISYETKITPQYERVSPFDFFPLWDSGGIDDGDIIERIYYRPDQLSDMIGLPGFREDEIKEILQKYENSGLDDWQTDVDTDRDEQEKQKKDESASTMRTKIACLEWWGAVSGKKLAGFGLKDESGEEPQDLDPAKIYHAKAWLIDKHIIKAAPNTEPGGEKPYSVSALEKIPGSIWGRGLPAHLKWLSAKLCAIDRAVVNNVGVASGPQVMANKEMFPEGYDFTLYPWKVWQSTGDLMASGQKPVDFFSPPLVVEKLIRAYEHYMKVADDTSVPSYAHGDTQVGGAGNTLGGLSMLMRGGARMVYTAIRNIDEDLIARTATKQFYWNLAHNPRKAIIGDLKVVARGSSYLAVKEQESIRMMEFARNTNNPLDAQITGVEGRRYLLTTAAKALNIDPEEAFPKPEMATPVNPMLMGQMKPANNQPGGRTLDAAGNPAQGKDFMMEKNQNA